MFSGCSKLTSLTLSSSSNTVKANSLSGMFKDCSSLSSLNLSLFNTAEASNFDSMFSGCSKLISLNLSSFNLAKAANFSNVFDGCETLEWLKIGKDQFNLYGEEQCGAKVKESATNVFNLKFKIADGKLADVGLFTDNTYNDEGFLHVWWSKSSN